MDMKLQRKVAVVLGVVCAVLIALVVFFEVGAETTHTDIVFRTTEEGGGVGNDG